MLSAMVESGTQGSPCQSSIVLNVVPHKEPMSTKLCRTCFIGSYMKVQGSMPPPPKKRVSQGWLPSEGGHPNNTDTITIITPA